MTVVAPPPPRIVEPIDAGRSQASARARTEPGPLRPTMTEEWFAEGVAAERALATIDRDTELPAIYRDYVRGLEPVPSRRRAWWALSLAGIATIACTLGTLLVA